MLEVKLIGVHRIRCTEPNTFTDEEIDKGAKSILESNGLISPLIVKLDHVERGKSFYSVVDGVFQYYTAVRASEIDPIKGESVQAIILDPELESSLSEQVKLFRNTKEGVDHERKDANPKEFDIQQLLKNMMEKMQKSLEETIDRKIQVISNASNKTPSPKTTEIQTDEISQVLSKMMQNVVDNKMTVTIEKIEFKAVPDKSKEDLRSVWKSTYEQCTIDSLKKIAKSRNISIPSKGMTKDKIIQYLLDFHSF